MFKKLLLFCCILAFTGITRAQRSAADSIKRILILPQSTNFTITPPQQYPDPGPIIGRYPIDPSWFTWVTPIWIGPCGEEHWDNGNLRSRIPCVNDVVHGKAVYWNENGTISTVYIYRNGKIYLKKLYDENGSYSIENYQYDRSGQQQKHGVCTTINDGRKTSETYKMGMLHGLSTELNDGKKNTQKMFVDDAIQWEKKWNQNGRQISETYWKDGNISIVKCWDDFGTLIQTEFYSSGKPSGEWFRYFPNKERKEVTKYEGGSIVSLEVYIKDELRSHNDYVNGLPHNFVDLFENGTKSSRSLYTQNGIDHERRKWLNDGSEIAHYSIEGDRYIGNGYYFLDADTKIQFAASSNANDLLPLVRWTLFKGDTIKQEFLVNSIANPHQVLETNEYSINSMGNYVKEGVWKTYNGNYLENTTTYRSGVRVGRTVAYSYNNGDPTPPHNWLLLEQSKNESLDLSI